MRERGQRRKVLGAYVRERLRAECAVRGVAAKISRATGFSTAHITNVQKEDRGIGDDFADAMARYWSLTHDQLQAEAERWAKDNLTNAGKGTDETGTAPAGGEEYPERLFGARIAAAAGVDQRAIDLVLAEPVPAERATWPALWWANRMQWRALEALPGASPAPAPSSMAAPPRAPGQALKSAVAKAGRRRG